MSGFVDPVAWRTFVQVCLDRFGLSNEEPSTSSCFFVGFPQPEFAIGKIHSENNDNENNHLFRHDRTRRRLGRNACWEQQDTSAAPRALHLLQ